VRGYDELGPAVAIDVRAGDEPAAREVSAERIERRHQHSAIVRPADDRHSDRRAGAGDEDGVRSPVSIDIAGGNAEVGREPPERAQGAGGTGAVQPRKARVEDHGRSVRHAGNVEYLTRLELRSRLDLDGPDVHGPVKDADEVPAALI